MRRTDDLKILKLDDVRKLFKVDRTTIRRRVKKGQFPPPKRSGHNVYWLESELEKFVRDGEA
jgi:predicted DNA-binding transcriptional regulator AlpA